MNMIVEITANTLHKLKISQRYRGYWSILSAMKLLAENECRLTAITKEIYMEIAQKEGQSWKAVERNIRTVAQQAWQNDPVYLQEIAGYSMTEAPSVGDFLSMLFENALSSASSEFAARS